VSDVAGVDQIAEHILFPQLQHCAYPGQLLHITINHLEMLKTIGDSEHLTVLIGKPSDDMLMDHHVFLNQTNLLTREQTRHCSWPSRRTAI
jgi:hypothetical protein